MSATGQRDRVESDFYPTPKKSFLPLLRWLPRHLQIWEPACGDGRLIRWMNDDGFEARGTDLALGNNFLTDNTPRECVVTNPPFSLAFEFVQHSVRVSTEVFLLLRLNFLASRKRKPFYQSHPVCALFPLSERPSFVAAVKCAKCKQDWIQKLEAPRPRFHIGPCGGPLKYTTSDSCDYGWFYWGMRHTQIHVL